jgi:hypothetical protein
LPQALQAGLITTGTFLGLEPKLLGSDDDIAEEVCVPIWWIGRGYVRLETGLLSAYASFLAMRGQKGGRCSLSDVLARTLQFKIAGYIGRR